MKINGLKHLNSNWYDYIMIRNLDLDNVKIDVKYKDKIPTFKNNDVVYNKIKKLSDKDKIIEIIKYYYKR